MEILQHVSKANGGKSHPNVLTFIDSWEEGEVLFIRTELCELGNLARFLWQYGRAFPRLDEAKVWKIIVDLSNVSQLHSSAPERWLNAILQGLRFIHNAGVIHLDLKPANIFITGTGRFKIGDFGMASLWPRPVTATAGSFEREGDKLYLAPEVLQGRYGKAADVFRYVVRFDRRFDSGFSRQNPSFGMTILETASNIVVPDQ